MTASENDGTHHYDMYHAVTDPDDPRYQSMWDEEGQEPHDGAKLSAFEEQPTRAEAAMSAKEQYDAVKAQATAEAYDAEAMATGWLGPQIAFDLVREYLEPGQSLLDLGIGTGLASMPFRKAGLRVHGMDISQEMLDACRWKGFGDLMRHDLTSRPYPYASASFDHVICLGVLPFLRDLSRLFAEAQRLLKTGGVFVFMTADRREDEEIELELGPEYAGGDESVTLYRHSADQISRWLDEAGFLLLRSVPFVIYMDSEKSRTMPCKCYAARKAVVPGLERS